MPQFVAISTHFDHVGQEARLASAKILRNLLASEPAAGADTASSEAQEWGGAVDDTIPTILCGDFNSVKLPVDTPPADSPFAVLVSQRTRATGRCL